MNDYFENYRSLKKEVDDVCFLINNNSCTKLKDEIDTLKDNFNSFISDEIWCDKVGEVFKEIVKKCSNKLKDVTVSIENNFLKAEELYKKLKEKLDELEKTNNDYREAYKIATAFTPEGTKSNVDTKSQLENLRTLESKINTLIEEIESIKKELTVINNSVVGEEVTLSETHEEEPVLTPDETPSENNNANTNVSGTTITIDDEQSVIKLANMCMAEQGSPEGAKFELSLLINQFKSVNGREPQNATELSEFMQNFGYGGGHWYAARTRNMASLTSADTSYINAITDVLNGNRVLPSNVVEHDCFSDIAKIVVNKQTLTDYNEIRNHANYIRDNTVIYNKMGSVYTFYEFAPNGGDPFGYF